MYYFLPSVIRRPPSAIPTFTESFMVNTNVNCRSCMLIRNIWCWILDSKVEVSTSIYGGIGTPLVTQQLTWWFKVHLSRKAHVSRAMLISELDCWWTKFNVEPSLVKLKSKVLTIALRTTKLNYKVECCDQLWFLAGLVCPWLLNN